MKFLLVLLLVINPLTDLDKIAKINKAKKEAEQAYLAKDYAMANTKYMYLKDSLGVTDEKLLLNLANTQFLLNDSTNAISSYTALKNSPNNEISSIASQQLGAMQFNSKKYEEALKHYKSALKANPNNTDARNNYELLKKWLKEQQEQQEQNKDQNNKDQENKDQKDQEKQDQEEQNKDKNDKQDQEQQDKENEDQEKQDQEKQDQEQKDQQQQEEDEKKEQQEQEEQNPDDKEKQDEEQQSKPNPMDEEKLKEMKITEEKARLILEAMKNNEVQYIQQNKRKAKKKKDPSKPDW